MPAMNVFDSDLFSLTTMTAALNHQEPLPSRIRQLGYFEEKGITTTSIWIERKSGKLQLVGNKERGTPGQTLERQKRDAIGFGCMHLPQEDFIMADEVQNVRAFGTEDATQTIESIRNDKLERMRRNLDLTTEYHRVGALQGKIYDKDGETVIEDLFDRFKLTKTTGKLGLTTDGKGKNDFRNKARELKRTAKKKLGGNTFVGGWRAICGVEYFNNLVAHEEIKRAWDRYNDSEMLRIDPIGGFEYAGIKWEDYDGEFGGDYLIPEDKALLIPEGVHGLFLTRYAPAPWMDTVNTMGLPYYARSKPEEDEYIKLKAQSNPIHLCTIPDAIIELSL